MFTDAWDAQVPIAEQSHQLGYVLHTDFTKPIPSYNSTGDALYIPACTAALSAAVLFLQALVSLLRPKPTIQPIPTKNHVRIIFVCQSLRWLASLVLAGLSITTELQAPKSVTLSAGVSICATLVRDFSSFRLPAHIS